MIGVKVSILKLTSRDVNDLTPFQLKALDVIYYLNRLSHFLWMSWFVVGAMLRFGKLQCDANLLLTYDPIQC